MASKLKRLWPYFMLGLFTFALWSVYRQLHGYHWHDLLSAVRQMSPGQIWTAVLLTMAGYAVMTGYDMLALRYTRHPLESYKTALASFLGYAFSNNAGYSLITGASIRYRIYTGWGLSSVEIARIVVFCSVSLWMGFIALSGSVFLFEPFALPEKLHLPFESSRPLGIVLLGLLCCSLVVRLFRKTVDVRGWSFPLPSWPTVAGQLAISVADWLLAGLVLFSLWPHPAPVSFGQFMAVFLVAQLGGMVSQVPGGLGVFESIVLLLAPPVIPAPHLLGILIVYRGIYYLLPLLAAILLLSAEELWRRKKLLGLVGGAAGQIWARIFVSVLSLTVFLSGAVLLFSGALPAVSHRLLFLDRVLPLAVLEASHFIGSIAGMMLIMLARALQRRLDAGYVLTLVCLAVGIAASLFKGLDYEEALILLIVMLVLLPNRMHFFRKASLFSERFTSGWIAAIVIVMITAAWLGMFAFRHVEYSRDLWWQFSLTGDAPRFMRAGIGALALVLILGLARLLKPAPPAFRESDPQEKALVSAIVERSPKASAHLALLGDKRFFINPDRSAFIMYGVSGQSWISMGDPVGPEDQWPDLIWQFHGNAQRHADRTVFYEVAHTRLHLYLDMGLTTLKLGEEARVPLTDFSLEGGDRKGLRYIHRKVAKLGLTFEMIPAADIDPLLEHLKTISDAWLKEKNTREKGFSLGFFDAGYLRQTPVALVRAEGKPIAFANVWCGADREELTVDLMRYVPGAPSGVMEFLFVEMMLWGHAQGFRWYNLGMAPLSGMESREEAPLWHKLGYWVARHGEHFYNFMGLRLFKQKFDPVWEPKYLACQGGLSLPRILADIGALVSGGIKGILFK
jgi:phosphatidylglycerol lysyltransferase